MKHSTDDLNLKEALASLPYHRPSARFNANVMKALGFDVKPAFNWALTVEKIIAVAAVCWLTAACLLLIGLLSAHTKDILLICLKPHALLSLLKFYALKSWFAGSEIISVLSKAAGIISFFAGKTDILPKLVISSVLAAITIKAVSGGDYRDGKAITDIK